MNTASRALNTTSRCSSPLLGNSDKILTVGDQHLTIEEVVSVARYGTQVRLTDNYDVLRGVQASCDYINNAVATGAPIYGVTSGFGGMANVVVSSQDATLLQNNMMWFLKSGSGQRLPIADVRAAMLLRINSHLHGASGIRLELIQRMETFLNAGVTPYVYEFGSIGASGYLVPLSYITGSITGLESSYQVDFSGTEMDAPTALSKLGLKPLPLLPKEGLAMMNGTSVMTGIAANCVYDTKILLALSVGAHALAIQGLNGTNQSFHPFIHQVKPHSGQKWAAAQMLNLLTGSHLVRDELDGSHNYRDDLIQDRYSLRCLPQYMGPIVDGIEEIKKQIEVEINSATDNPLIDVDNQASYHGGNFLGQYVGVAMDRLRYYIGLLAKHLDVQIACLVAPEFNNGLSPSLVGNRERNVNVERGRRFFPHKTALIFEGKSFTYKELDEMVNRLANTLRGLGIQRGQRVALLLPNIPEFVISYLGILKIGAIAVSLNVMLKENEVKFILNDCSAQALITTESLSENVPDAELPELKQILIAEGQARIGTSLHELISSASPDARAVEMDRDEPATIIYTSGTTGFPKGATLSHSNVISNIYAANHCYRTQPEDRLLLFLPLFHCFGQNAVLNTGLHSCATIVLQRRFELEQVLSTIVSDRVTMFFGVPTVFIKLLNANTSDYDLSSVRYYFTAAATMPIEVIQRWQSKHGMVIYEGYGLTETSPFSTYNHDVKYKLGSIGSPIENLEMKIVNLDGELVQTGEVGALCLWCFWRRDGSNLGLVSQ